MKQTKCTIYLNKGMACAILRTARVDGRRPRDQAKFLIREALISRGSLKVSARSAKNDVIGQYDEVKHVAAN